VVRNTIPFINFNFLILGMSAEAGRSTFFCKKSGTGVQGEQGVQDVQGKIKVKTQVLIGDRSKLVPQGQEKAGNAGSAGSAGKAGSAGNAGKD
jgi:hypothetical protein